MKLHRSLKARIEDFIRHSRTETGSVDSSGPVKGEMADFFGNCPRDK